MQQQQQRPTTRPRLQSHNIHSVRWLAQMSWPCWLA